MNKTMYMKIHESGNNRIIAVCDSELLNEYLKEGEIVLNIKRYSGFYKGERVGPKDVEKVLGEYSSLNLVEEKAVNCALKKGIITKEQIITISGKPHVQVYHL